MRLQLAKVQATERCNVIDDSDDGMPLSNAQKRGIVSVLSSEELGRCCPDVGVALSSRYYVRDQQVIETGKRHAQIGLAIDVRNLLGLSTCQTCRMEGQITSSVPQDDNRRVWSAVLRMASVGRAYAASVRIVWPVHGSTQKVSCLEVRRDTVRGKAEEDT